MPRIMPRVNRKSNKIMGFRRFPDGRNTRYPHQNKDSSNS
nr:MAG TPA: hypothetical protein [Caudoviricetes sp.]